jgi:hypothetical protein
MTYKEKLKHPLWQKKRLEILERDNFTCKLCQNKEETLHIHHHMYEWGKDPWDYNNDVLDTMCSTCHAVVEYIKMLNKEIVVAGIFRKQTQEGQIVYAILAEKQEIFLCAFRFHDAKNIELLVDVPNKVIAIMSNLLNSTTKKNG